MQTVDGWYTGAEWLRVFIILIFVYIRVQRVNYQTGSTRWRRASRAARDTPHVAVRRYLRDNLVLVSSQHSCFCSKHITNVNIISLKMLSRLSPAEVKKPLTVKLCYVGTTWANIYIYFSSISKFKLLLLVKNDTCVVLGKSTTFTPSWTWTDELFISGPEQVAYESQYHSTNIYEL